MFILFLTAPKLLSQKLIDKTKNRFRSYSSALKRVNLMLKPINESYNDGMSDPIFEQDEEGGEERFVIKVDTPEDDMDMGDEEKEDEAIMPASDLSVEAPVEEIEPAFEGKKSETEQMREYVEKVAEPKGEDNKAKSPVAGKNDMGGTASNIAKGSAEEKGGSAMAPKEDNMGNVNVPGGKASKSMKADSKGHGAEKKGSGETGTDGKSVIGS